MSRTILLATLLTFFSWTANTQTERPLPPVVAIAEAPWWAQQMYGATPNIVSVDSAFSVWKIQYPSTRNSHTQYYKHWRRAIGSHVSLEGDWTTQLRKNKNPIFRTG